MSDETRTLTPATPASELTAREYIAVALYPGARRGAQNQPAAAKDAVAAADLLLEELTGDRSGSEQREENANLRAENQTLRRDRDDLQRKVSAIVDAAA